MLKDGDKKPGVHRGRYNMDFDPVKGDPYGNMQKARERIDALKNRERKAKDQGGAGVAGVAGIQDTVNVIK